MHLCIHFTTSDFFVFVLTIHDGSKLKTYWTPYDAEKADTIINKCVI